MAGVLAVAEAQRDALAGVSRETVSVARSLADALGVEVDAAVAGASAAELARWGADRILEFEGAALAAEGGPDAWATALAHRARAVRYRAVVFAATAAGRDLAPRVAAKLSSPLLTDVTEVGVVDGQVSATRPVFAGKALADVRVPDAPALLSIRPNVFPPVEAPRDAVRESVEADVGGAVGGYRVRGFEPSRGAALDVSEASVVVSGGRGLKGPENWGLLESLRDALGEEAALGASRAVVDAGWRPHSEQVGQTGKTVTPKLYFAVGISGAIQHLAGMRTSGVIVAINRDADAPIFGVADYGIVGDAFEVVPELVSALGRLRDEG